MSKADFFALAEKRIRDNAGSGFAEWGKHRDNGSQYIGVNQGLYVKTDVSNTLHMSPTAGSSGLEGDSRTLEPIAMVNGVQHRIDADIISFFNNTTLLFPPAPDGTKTYDSATGTVVTHATSNEAFEGLVTNGDFRNGVTGWDVEANSGAVDNGDGSVSITPTNTLSRYLYQTIPMASKRIQVVFMANYTGNILVSGEASLATVPCVAGEIQTYTTELSAGATYGLFAVTTDATGLGTNSITVYSTSVMPATEKVITTRQDFAFLESFHEKISDKDVVYPLGNVQYGASTWEGISLSNALVAQGYSAFGEWDTTTTGRGVTWSTLSAADKVKFLQDPENNIYNDDGELIQVRYRARVIEGLGDDWAGATGDNYTNNITYDGYSDIFVKPQGSLTSITSDLASFASNESGLFQGPNLVTTTAVTGEFQATQNISGSGAYVPDTNIAHNGLCFALPIALVQRLNQGAYHPVYNPEGTANYHISGVSIYEWYNLPTPMTSLADCMSYNVGTEGSISGGATFAGRPTNDPFTFYDAIYAGQVQDLRTSSNLQTTNELLNEYSRKGIAGTIRGKESVPFTKAQLVAITSTNVLASNMGQVDVTDIAVGDYCWLVDPTNAITRVQINAITSGSVIAWDAARWGYISRTSGQNWYVLHESLRTSQYETLPWQDIIGNPTNIAATFPDGVYGQWIPVIPTGSSLEFPLSRKSKDIQIARYFTNDTGSTWFTSTNTLNSIGNSFSYSMPANRIGLWTYSTPANPYELANNAVVIDELGDVFASHSNLDIRGQSLISSLIGKVGISESSPAVLTNFGVPRVDIILPDSNKLYTDISYIIDHDTITLGNNGGTPTVKAFPYITSENSQYYLQWVYKEMIWDTSADSTADFTAILGSDTSAKTVGTLYFVTSSDKGRNGAWRCGYATNVPIDNATWTVDSDGSLLASNSLVYFKRWDGNGFGDDNKFNIVSGESTVLDDNGNAVIVGQKRVTLPFFTGKAS